MTSEARAARCEGPRIRREKVTVAHMILVYCRGMHPEAEKRNTISGIRNTCPQLCEDCYTLYEYSQKRLTYCRFGEDKTTCANCPIHCYAPQEREKIKQVMRYAGARMLLRHPWLAFRHMFDGRQRSSS
ncbi:nitrous oxide-stimulated promoter family protein [Paenibacillus lentus]|uniref:Nitrous oxide-stimulated promoter family protein n=1 Tax=Paenibacillus lentus TaxID=1338368 RepID=A0A3S8RS31_9BACL|nr:nitrous oxide-stimulated promoter family protein [Paenibacillus lentus]AZK45796.1 nitrous oxide-stimulated promoter family protein [Paenibacillus lentus]